MRRDWSSAGTAGGGHAARVRTALRRELRRSSATVVHSNGLKAHVSAALAKPAGVRLVWHLHDYVQSRPLTATLLRAACAARRRDRGELRQRPADASAVLGAGTRRCGGSTTPSTCPVLRRTGRRSISRRCPACPTMPASCASAWSRRSHGGRAMSRSSTRSRGCTRRCRVRGYIIGGAVYETAGSQWSLEELRRAGAGARAVRTWSASPATSTTCPAALRSARHRGPREHGARTIRDGDRGGDGLPAARSWRRAAAERRSCSRTASTAIGHTPGRRRASSPSGWTALVSMRRGGRRIARGRAMRPRRQRFAPERMARGVPRGVRGMISIGLCGVAFLLCLLDGPALARGRPLLADHGRLCSTASSAPTCPTASRT